MKRYNKDGYRRKTWKGDLDFVAGFLLGVFTMLIIAIIIG